jgi:hypothetical protein
MNPCSPLRLYIMTLSSIYKTMLSLYSLLKVSSLLSYILLFSSSGPSSPCFIPIISPLEDPTHDHTHTHSTSSPTGLLQLSPTLLSRYAMQPVFPPTSLTKKAAQPSGIKVTNY